MMVQHALDDILLHDHQKYKCKNWSERSGWQQEQWNEVKRDWRVLALAAIIVNPCW